ncbi:MAG: hypothetical protein ACOYMP_06850 [Nodosilinea sp.]
MSQNETTNTVTLTTQPIGIDAIDPDSLVSTYADSLMSSLFEDVDKILAGDLNALATVEASLGAENAQSQPQRSSDSSDLNADPADTSQALTTTGGDALDNWVNRPDTTDTIQVAPPASGKTRWGRLFDHFLLFSTGLSLLGLIGFFWMHQRQSALQVAGGPAANPTAAVSQSDAEFLQYLQRSLEVIGKKAEQVKASGQEASQGIAGDMPLLPPLGLSPGGAGGPINVIERIYIPYQTAGTPPVLPQPVSPAAGASAPAAEAITPGVVHVLVGVLELGDRSAALFEINGVPQRVYIGEAIGNAGWSLVSIRRDDVRIRRNGEIRSIYIGQQF